MQKKIRPMQFVRTLKSKQTLWKKKPMRLTLKSTAWILPLKTKWKLMHKQSVKSATQRLTPWKMLPTSKTNKAVCLGSGPNKRIPIAGDV